MKIYIGSDHAGVLLKDEIVKHLSNKVNEVIDIGTYSTNSCDYPDYAFQVAKNVARNNAIGILVCYTGIGMSIAANKVKGIRASLVNSVENAVLTKEHNDSNVLCLAAKDLTTDLALKIVDAYLSTPFSNMDKHARRVNKIILEEQNNGK